MRGQTGKSKTISFGNGVIILTVSAILVKIFGFLCKIPLLSLLGGEGMGYFNSAYEVFAPVCVIATAGIPAAMSILISAKPALTGEIYRKARNILLIIGAFSSIVMYFCSDIIASLFGSPGMSLCIKFISPASFFICMTGALRGYFQGKENMIPTAVSQIAEAGGKLVFGVAFAYIALTNGFSLEYTSAAATAGFTLGCALSMVYLLISKSISKKKEQPAPVNNPGGVLKELFTLAIPITLSASVTSITRISDAALILRRLQSNGFSASDANMLFGSYTTLAVPLFGLIPAFITAISTPMMPMLSSLRAQNRTDDAKKNITDVVRLTNIISLPASCGFAFFSSGILTLLFGSCPEEISIAAPLLSVLAVALVPSCLITVTCAVLQTYGKPGLALISMLCGAGIKIISEYFLILYDPVGIYGAPISTFICVTVTCVMNIIFIWKQSGWKFPVPGLLLRPAAASALSIGAVFAASRFLPSGNLATLIYIALSAVLYIIVSVLMGVIGRDDLLLIPGGKKINKLLLKKSIRKEKSQEIV